MPNPPPKQAAPAPQQPQAAPTSVSTPSGQSFPLSSAPGGVPMTYNAPSNPETSGFSGAPGGGVSGPIAQVGQGMSKQGAAAVQSFRAQGQAAPAVGKDGKAATGVATGSGPALSPSALLAKENEDWSQFPEVTM